MICRSEDLVESLILTRGGISPKKTGTSSWKLHFWLCFLLTTTTISNGQKTGCFPSRKSCEDHTERPVHAAPAKFPDDREKETLGF